MGLGRGGSSPWILRKDGFGQLRLYLCDFASSRRRQRAAENHPTAITSTEDSGLGTFPFQKLPPEVQLKILEQCSTSVLQSLRLVCRSINRLIARNWSRLPPRRIGTVAVLQDFLMSDNDFLYKKCISREFSSFYGATISMLYFDQVEVTWAIFQQLSRALKRSRISVVVLAASNCTFTCSANDFADFLKSHCIDRMVIEMRRVDDFSMKLWRDLKYEHVQSLSCFVLHAGAGNTWFFERIRRGMFSFRDFRRVLFDFMDGKLNIEFIRVQGRIEWANSDTARRALSLRDPLFESFMLENPSGQRLRTYCSAGSVALYRDQTHELPTVGTTLSYPLRLAFLVLILAFFVFIWQFVVIIMFIRNSLSLLVQEVSTSPFLLLFFVCFTIYTAILVTIFLNIRSFMRINVF